VNSSEIKETPLVIPVNKKQIVGMIHLPPIQNPKVIIMCHGYTGDKVGPWPYLFVTAARFFAKNGWAVIRFDFRGSGESSGSWEEQNLETEIEDLGAVLNYVTKRQELNQEKIGVIGHSRGGALALIKTSQDSRIKSLVTWAAVANWKPLWGKTAGEISKKGYISFSSFKETGQLLKIDFKYDPVTNFSSKINVPTLIIHGEKDGKRTGEVPLSHAKALLKSIKSRKALFVIKGAGHLFFAEKHRQQLFKQTLDWFDGTLK